MPIYEYRCDACGAAFEQLRPMTAMDTAACPSCGAADARRIVSRTASIGASCGSGGFT